MARKIILGVVASVAFCGASAAGADAATINLEMSQGAAFNALGHWCGGIKEKVYETGFAANGYPQGNVFMETTCGGSGKGGGGGHTTYTGTASVVWTWLGETWKWGPMVGTLEAHAAEDSHGDKLYNVTPCATGYHVETCAYLETGTPPYEPPAAPGNVHASAYLAESGETEYLELAINWSQDPERLGLLTTQTVRVEPVGGKGSVLEEEVRPYFSEARIGVVEPDTLYKVSVTESDNEGTSAPGTVEIKTPNSDGEGGEEPKEESPLPPLVVTSAATEVTQTSATLNGTVNPEGQAISGCQFEYGSSTSYGELVACSALPGSGTSPVAVSAPLTSLAPGTTYHYRLVAFSLGGTSYGADQTLTTAAAGPAPVIKKISPKSGPAVGGTTVTITGTGFTGATQVKFGAAEGTIVSVNSNTSMTVVSPAGTKGTVNVTVTSLGGESTITSKDRFKYKR